MVFWTKREESSGDGAKMRFLEGRFCRRENKFQEDRGRKIQESFNVVG